jgi:3-hydroxyisobutyrate dehydrogenase-like beta-hydroxyacid dehydrogenase
VVNSFSTTMNSDFLPTAVYGLGIIGSRVAARLHAAGVPLATWNRTPKPDAPGFVADASRAAGRSLLHQIFTRDEAAVEAVLAAISPVIGPGHIVAVHATVSPAAMIGWAERVAATGAAFLDAPFTGSRLAAENAKLVYYIGGDESALAAARPVFELSARAIRHFGPVGHATVLKIATNMVTASTVEILAEAAALTRAAGVSPALFAEAMTDNASRSGTSDLKLPGMLTGDFTPHFSLKNMLKDARLAADMARASGLDLPAHAATTACMESLAACSEENAESDFSILGSQWDKRNG